MFIDRLTIELTFILKIDRLKKSCYCWNVNGYGEFETKKRYVHFA